MYPLPKSWNSPYHSGVLFILRNFLFICVTHYTCQVVLLCQAYFNANNASHSHIHFPRKQPLRARWSGSLGCTAGVELILGFSSSHWCLVQWEESKLVPDSKFSLLRSQNVRLGQKPSFGLMFFPSKCVRCQIARAAATVTLLRFLKWHFKDHSKVPLYG